MRLLPRIKVYWGEWGMVESTLSGLKVALAEQPAVDFFVLISGQDYPIKSQDYLKSFYKNNIGSSFLSYTSMPVRDWNWELDGGMDRLHRYFIRVGNYRWAYPPYAPPKGIKQNALYFFAKGIYRLPRPQPEGITPYAGATWWLLHRNAASFILDFVNLHPDYIRFHRNTKFVDEIFFQTILCNGPEKIRLSLVNNDLRFIDWKHKDENMGHPQILRMQHRDELAQSDAIFARKFDPRIDPEILDWIDQHLL